MADRPDEGVDWSEYDEPENSGSFPLTLTLSPRGKRVKWENQSTARLMIGIEQSNFELVQENDSFFFERDFFMIL